MSGIRSAGSGDFQTIPKGLQECGYKLICNLYKSDNIPNDSIHENTESVPDEYVDQEWRIELSEKLKVIN